LAGHIGVLFLIIAIVAHIIGNTYIASSGALLSFFCIKYYINLNSAIILYEGDWMVSQFWIRYIGFFLILLFFIYPYLYCLLIVFIIVDLTLVVLCDLYVIR